MHHKHMTRCLCHSCQVKTNLWTQIRSLPGVGVGRKHIKGRWVLVLPSADRYAAKAKLDSLSRSSQLASFSLVAQFLFRTEKWGRGQQKDKSI